MPEPTAPTKEFSIVDWLSRHWFLLAFVLTSGVAWGQYTQKVEKIEDVVKQQAATGNQLNSLKSQVGLLQYRAQKLDESTKQILEAQSQQSKDIQTLIILQQKTLNGVNSNGKLVRQQQPQQ